jgi:radical SAM protein with 4Fe4S-binding SPASM domain
VINFNSIMKRIIDPGGQIEPPAPGIYRFMRSEQEENSKIHLRIDKDKNAILLINASRILHLNPVAAFMAYLALNHIPDDRACKAISRVYHVSQKQLFTDYAQFTLQLGELLRPDGACPIHDLGLDTIPPFSAKPSAPYRMDLAITYRCNNDCSHCYNARPRSFPEISTQQWKDILDRLWDQGIPHVVFTGGEPTLRADLPELIAHAEHNGQITGVNTNGRRLSDRQYVQELVQAGLDHVQITLESHDPQIHNNMVKSDHAWEQTVAGLRNVLESPLYVMTNTTMLCQNSPGLEQTLEFLAELGVPTVGLNALIYAGKGLEIDSGIPEAELPPLLELARSATSAHQQRLIWYTPTQYCHFDPVQMELGVKGCTAALYNMCIEPNGDVLPCQSYYQQVGNILEHPWENIWEHPLCRSLRERQNIPVKCHNCAILSECGGGCPLHNQAHALTGGLHDQHS